MDIVQWFLALFSLLLGAVGEILGLSFSVLPGF